MVILMKDICYLVNEMENGNIDSITFKYNKILYFISIPLYLGYKYDGKNYIYNFDTIDELINAKVLHDGKSIKEVKMINIVDIK